MEKEYGLDVINELYELNKQEKSFYTYELEEMYEALKKRLSELKGVTR